VREFQAHINMAKGSSSKVMIYGGEIVQVVINVISRSVVSNPWVVTG